MANWLNFEQLRHWDEAPYALFQYDNIADDVIAHALADEVRVAQVPVHRDWEDDAWLRDHTEIAEHHKHAYRVAALVRALRNGERLQRGICLDTFALASCGCGISDGHHRIRALQYLGVEAGPFWLSGYVDLLEPLVAKIGCAAPVDHAHYFSERLLRPDPDDIVLQD